MTQEYITKHFDDIKMYASVIEKRLDDSDCTKESVLKENKENLVQCQKYGCNYILIEDEYEVEIRL